MNNQLKNVIVTGANGGMGRRVCSLLADSGFRVFALDITSTEPRENVIPFVADVTDIDSLFAAKQLINYYTDKIFAVINLAGFFAMDSIILGDEAKLRKAFEINFWGVYRVNRVFFDMLDKNSRIIVMSSEIARFSPHPFDGFYALPKITLDKYCDVLRREARFLGVRVIKIQAGSFNTNMTKRAADEFDALKNNARCFGDVLDVFDKFVGAEIDNGNNADIMANKILKILNAKKPKICYRVKNSVKLGLISALPEKTQDDIYPFAVKLFGKKNKK